MGLEKKSNPDREQQNLPGMNQKCLGEIASSAYKRKWNQMRELE